MTAAEKNRRRRARQAKRSLTHYRRKRAGLIVAKVIAEEVGLTEALIAAGWLDPRFELDHDAIERAINEALKEIVKGNGIGLPRHVAKAKT